MSDCALFNFVVWGIGGVVLCCFGYTGNSLSLIALQRDTRTPATTLLQSLAVSDLVLLTCVCIADFVPRICEFTGGCSNIWHIWPQIRFLWFLIPMSHMCSIYLAVLIAANRYWAVCRPHHTASVWTNHRTWIYIACVVCVVVLFNLPRIFEYQIVAVVDDHVTKMADNFTTHEPEMLNCTTGNGSSCEYIKSAEQEVIKYEERKTEFGERYIYRVVYKVLLVNSLLILLPLGFLLVTSVWIIRSLRLSNSNSMVKKRKTTEHDTTEDRKSNPSREITFVLVTVVLVTVVCQTPLAIFHFVRYTYDYVCGDVVFYLENISKFLVNLNSCVNFVIYCILGPRFRRLLYLAVTCAPRSSLRSRLSSKSLQDAAGTELCKG